MSGRMTAPIMAAGNRMLAIGTPLPRLFFDPQNTMAISSGRGESEQAACPCHDEQNGGEEHAVEHREDERSRGANWCHSPFEDGFSKGIVDDQQDCAAIHEPVKVPVSCSTHCLIHGRAMCPTRNGTRICITTHRWRSEGCSPACS